MKWPFFVAVLCVLLLALPSTALAAPLVQDTPPVIAQPAQDTAVRGIVQIIGTATHPQFQRYELYYAPWPVPSDQSWIFIGDAHFNQQPLGILGTWDSRSVPDGTYALRVRVVRADGNYADSDPRRVLVANTRPVASPTPIATDTPEPISTEAPPTPTIVIAVATAVGTKPPEPTPTPEPEVTPLLPTAQVSSPSRSTSGVSELTSQLFSGQRLLDTARKAALYTVGAFVALGLFFGVKALLVWLWHKIRP